MAEAKEDWGLVRSPRGEFPLMEAAPPQLPPGMAAARARAAAAAAAAKL